MKNLRGKKWYYTVCQYHVLLHSPGYCVGVSKLNFWKSWLWTPLSVAALPALPRSWSLVWGIEQSFVAHHHLVLLFWGTKDFFWQNIKSLSCLAMQAAAQSCSKGHELTCQGHFFKRGLIEGQPVAIKVCFIQHFTTEFSLQAVFNSCMTVTGFLFTVDIGLCKCWSLWGADPAWAADAPWVTEAEK